MLTFILDLLFTIFCYCFIPVIIKIYKGKLEKNTALIIVIINCLLVLLFFNAIYIEAGVDKLPNVFAAFIWGSFSYYLLVKNKEENIKTLYDTFPKVLPSYNQNINKKISKEYIKNLEFFIENDKLLGKVNPYNNKIIDDYSKIREYYNQYLNEQVNDK